MKLFSIKGLIGLFVLLLGVLSLLNAFNLIDNSNYSYSIFDFWPLFIIFPSLNFSFSALKRRSVLDMVFSFLLLAFGISLLGRNLGFEAFENINLNLAFQIGFPIILIIFGISLLTGKKSIGGTHYAIMSGIEQKNSGWQLKSSSYLAFWGGAELDIRKAEILEDETILNLTAIMGGIEVKVPDDIKVICEGKVFLGGVEQLGEEIGGVLTSNSINRNPKLPDDHPNKNKVIKIYSNVILGGISVN